MGHPPNGAPYKTHIVFFLILCVPPPMTHILNYRQGGPKRLFACPFKSDEFW